MSVQTLVSKHLPWFITISVLLTVGAVTAWNEFQAMKKDRRTPEKRIEWTQKRGQTACDDRVFKLIEQQRWCWFISAKGREALCIQDLNK